MDDVPVAVAAIDRAIASGDRGDIQAAIAAVRLAMQATYPDGFQLTGALGKTRGGYAQRAALAHVLKSRELDPLSERLMQADMTALQEIAARIQMVDPSEIYRNPGAMDISRYAKVEFGAYLAQIATIVQLGMIPAITFFHPEAWLSRDPRYIEAVLGGLPLMIAPEVIDVYRQLGLNPHFVGIEVLSLPTATKEEERLHRMLTRFKERWEPIPGGVPYIIELFPVTLYEWTQLVLHNDDVRQAYEAAVARAENPTELYHNLVSLVMEVLSGVKLPLDGIYVGCAMNGKHIRSELFSIISAVKRQRLFHIALPNLLMTELIWLRLMREVLDPQTILRTAETTYKDQIGRDQMAWLINHTLRMWREPDQSIIGLVDM